MKSTSTCSCGSVVPSCSGKISPETETIFAEVVTTGSARSRDVQQLPAKAAFAFRKQRRSMLMQLSSGSFTATPSARRPHGPSRAHGTTPRFPQLGQAMPWFPRSVTKVFVSRDSFSFSVSPSPAALIKYSEAGLLRPVGLKPPCRNRSRTAKRTLSLLFSGATASSDNSRRSSVSEFISPRGRGKSVTKAHGPTADQVQRQDMPWKSLPDSLPYSVRSSRQASGLHSIMNSRPSGRLKTRLDL